MIKLLSTIMPLLFIASLLNACSPSRAVHGNLVTEERRAEVEIGQSTKSDVIRSLGSPTSKAAFDNDVWYYVGLETIKQGFLDAEVDMQKIFVAQFDDKGVLQDFFEKTPERAEFPIVDRETPTHGSELTIMEQFLGNVGRFNSDLEGSTSDR